MKLTIREYLTPQGKNPLPRLVERPRRWRSGTYPGKRFENGNLGDHKSVGNGVWEVRLDFGPGYRLYFGKDGLSVILLLAGGDKSSQSKDIATAIRHWKDFKEVKHDKAK